MILTWKYQDCPRVTCDGVTSTVTGETRPLTLADAVRRLTDLARHGGRVFDEEPRMRPDAQDPVVPSIEMVRDWFGLVPGRKTP